jgi:hypothetical protein
LRFLNARKQIKTVAAFRLGTHELGVNAMGALALTRLSANSVCAML